MNSSGSVKPVTTQPEGRGTTWTPHAVATQSSEIEAELMTPRLGVKRAKLSVGLPFESS